VSAEAIALFALAAGLVAAFIAVERRAREPMLDVRIFRNLRFSAASAAITVSFFALAGFIFLITQYFQFLKGYGPFENGLRLLPVATSVALGSIVGTQVAVRHGTKIVVGGGLAALTVGYAWTSTVSTATSYAEIAGQMVVLGLGMGLTSAPATESVMGAVSRGKAGVGSAINDAARELGATLGVAVIGSVFASLYAAAFTLRATGALPADAVRSAEESIGAALLAAGTAGEAGAPLRAVAESGFFDGLQAGCLVAAGVCLVGSIFAFLVLPAQPEAEPDDEAEIDAGRMRADAAPADRARVPVS
jgi:hypothetical protein